MFWDKIQNIVKYLEDMHMEMIPNLYEQYVFSSCVAHYVTLDFVQNYLTQNPVLEV